MKKSVILDIFNGVRGHREMMNMPKESVNKNASIICDTGDELKEKLSPELLSLHEKLVEALEDNWAEALEFYFVEGFKLGLLIGIECMEN